MSAFYFGLLSHLIGASARSKYDYDVEDAFILNEISNFFKRQSLTEIDPNATERKAIPHDFYIDGLIRVERFDNLVQHAMQSTFDFERNIMDHQGFTRQIES